MKINPYIFRGYDIRGIVDQDLNPEIVERIGRAHGTLLKRRGIKKAVVGYDCRKTSPEYSQSIIKGLNWAGVDVINIGMELVGTFYWSQYYLNCQGGVYVSASHNPAQYNGFKLANDFSETLVTAGIQEIKEMVEKESYEKAEVYGKAEEQNIRQAYFNDLLKRFSLKKGFKIVVDPSCSTAGVIVPELLRQAGFKVVEKNCKIDPSFPIGVADPTDVVVAKRLGKEVVEEKADIGFTYDADGDRLGIVDEKGGTIWNDVLVAIFAIGVLKKHPGDKIMYNTLCSKVVEDVILREGGEPFMWRTGHSFLKKKNQEVKAAFIGELSGHFFFSKDFYNHDDGVYSCLYLLEYLGKTGKSLSEVVASLPKYISSPEIKIYCADDKKVELMKEISPLFKRDFLDAEVIDDQRAGDGVRVSLEDGMFVIRYSQNGPYLTVKFEAKTKEKYNFLKNYINKFLHNYKEVDWDSDINLNTDTLS
ncbi:MAG: phosphomannomutase/phosphoglucomutase [Candidatus Staskawiczbacteria bacterium]|nr:phosphomannomutase/phosphoglucomutase [Candidatus Staskawiczbacteria bacterium]